MSESRLKVAELKPGMERVSIFVRVVDPGEIKKISTRAGERTIREAIVGDESGRVKLVMWGRSIKTLNRGDVIEISGAWTTVFKGKIQLNVGGSENIKVVEDLGELPPVNEVPEEEPRAEGMPPRRPKRREFRQRRSWFTSRSRGEEFE